VHKFFHKARLKAGITKKVSVHGLRHYAEFRIMRSENSGPTKSRAMAA